MAKRNKLDKCLKIRSSSHCFLIAKEEVYKDTLKKLVTGKKNAIGFVYPKASLVQVANSSLNSSDEVIVLLGGTNDTLSSDFNLKTIYSSLEKT